jgi:hypothetical protein
MRRAALVAAACLAAAGSPALALSCMRPDPVRDYVAARDAVARFRVVHGTFLPNAQAEDFVSDEGRGSRVTGRLSGLSLGRAGFATPYDEVIVVRAFCLADWCGRLPSGGARLYFVELAPDGPRVTTSSCGGGFIDVDADALKRVVTCHRTGHCPVDDG